jgi:hypothetical protein
MLRELRRLDDERSHERRMKTNLCEKSSSYRHDVRVESERVAVESEEIDQPVRSNGTVDQQPIQQPIRVKEATYSSPTLCKFPELHSFLNASVSSKNQMSFPFSSYAPFPLLPPSDPSDGGGDGGGIRCRLGSTGGDWMWMRKKRTRRVKP